MPSHTRFQVMFIVAMFGFLAYYGYYGLWAIFIPTTFSVVTTFGLILLKVYFEEFSPQRTANEVAAVTGEDTGGESEPRSNRKLRARGNLVGSAKYVISTSDEQQPLMSYGSTAPVAIAA